MTDTPMNDRDHLDNDVAGADVSEDVDQPQGTRLDEPGLDDTDYEDENAVVGDN